MLPAAKQQQSFVISMGRVKVPNKKQAKRERQVSSVPMRGKFTL